MRPMHATCVTTFTFSNLIFICVYTKPSNINLYRSTYKGCMSLLLLTRNLKSNELYETHKRNVYGLLVQIQNSNMLHMHACDGCSWP